MNVLMISYYFPPDWNGDSTRAYNAARGLTLQGCNVTIISAFPHYPHGYTSNKYKRKILALEEIHGIKVIRTWVPNLSHSPIIKRILLHISFMFSCLLGFFYMKKNIDIIFAMNPNFFAFYPAFIYKILVRKKIIRNVDDLWPEVFYDLGIIKSPIFKRILDFIASISYRIPVAIIPVSHGYVQTLIKKYNIPQQKIAVIEHGVDTKIFHSREENSSSNDNRRLHYNKKTKKTIMYSGAISTGYDFDIVLKAAKLLESEPVYFVIRGKGELSDRLNQMIKQYDIRNVDITTDFLSKEELVSFLSNADIFLLPMSSSQVIDQGLPTKLFEYQALGKPIICISSGEAGQYIAKTQSGLVTASRQPEELAQLIMHLVNNEELMKKLGTNGYNNVNRYLTVEIIGKRFMDIIRRIQKE
jgi:glycosyltransferase involved in cell wall biosynthesis